MKVKKVKKAFGTHKIARLCQVTPPTVIRWMEEGKLHFFTTGGGHRRVWDSDVLRFMCEHKLPVPPELLYRSGLKVLIVEDEAMSRQLIGRAIKLSYPKAEIAEAVDGFGAGSKIYSFHPDLIVLDIQLPMLNGFEVCEMIRADAALRGIKILAITGYEEEESRRRALSAGADDFLAKPFNVEQLAEKLSDLLPAFVKTEE